MAGGGVEFFDPRQFGGADLFSLTGFIFVSQIGSAGAATGDFVNDVSGFGNGQTFNGTTNHAAYVYPDSGTYQVTLITQYYCGADTALITVHVSDAVSGVVSLKGDGVKISIAPNPFGNQTKVLIDKTPGENFEAKIFSVEGKLIRDLGTTANNQLVIERGNLSAGNYFLLISNNYLKTTLKLMVE